MGNFRAVVRLDDEENWIQDEDRAEWMIANHASRECRLKALCSLLKEQGMAYQVEYKPDAEGRPTAIVTAQT